MKIFPIIRVTIICTATIKTAMITAAFLFFFCTAPAFAQDKPESSATEIITDQENGTITIVIDGEAVAMFDKDGFHVVGDVDYGGSMTDAGRENVQAAIESRKDVGTKEGTDAE